MRSCVFRSCVYRFYLISLYLSVFFFQLSVPHRDLHSFPTRRSSDLDQALGPHGAAREPRPAARPVYRRRAEEGMTPIRVLDRKSTRLNSSHVANSYAVFFLKKKKKNNMNKFTVNRHKTTELREFAPR